MPHVTCNHLLLIQITRVLLMKILTPLKSGLIVAFSSLLLTTSSFAADYLTVKNDDVNVRTGPSTDYQVKMEVFKGYPFKVVSKKGDWIKVSDFEGDTGWIYSNLVSDGDTVIVTGNKVNMRASTSTKSAVIAEVERGVVFTQIGKEGDWVKVRHSGGTIGWIYKKLIWPNL